MLMLSVGKGRQVIKQLCRRVLQYYATVATKRAGYVLYRALVSHVLASIMNFLMGILDLHASEADQVYESIYVMLTIQSINTYILSLSLVCMCV